EAYLLVHVVDISHPQFEEQIEVVNKTLREICGDNEKPMILVFNKIDAYKYVPKDPTDLMPATRENVPLEQLEKTWMARMDNNCVFISAKKQINIAALKDMLYEKAKEIHTQRFPYNDFLYQTYDNEEYRLPDNEQS
ncbi:MAG: GTPase HflX, partial [Muribaculaceae bacterium]|nr:GTPase HflX [Muribaculaceae bacterium]